MKQAAGVVIESAGKVLLLKRDTGEWGLAGGKMEAGETPEQGAKRETFEECGFQAAMLEPLGTVVNTDGFEFHAFIARVGETFEAVLSDEHSEAGWFDRHQLPQPLFMATGDLIEQAFGVIPAMDANDTSARQIDSNGWYEIKSNPISKVGVFPYLGKNIPGADPSRVYMVYRPAEELSDSATIESFKLVPWINDHVMLGNKPGTVAAEKKGVHGVTGQEVYFDTDTLYGNIKLFSASHAAVIDSGKIDLSLGYRCRYEFAPGVFNGEAYEYVQRFIRGNHVASVDSGRMGAEVSVLDGKDEIAFTFDSKDLLTMADDKKDTPAAGEGGSGEPTVAEAVKQLETLMPTITKLMAIVNPAGATAAPVVDKQPEALAAVEDSDEEKAKKAAAAGAAAAAADTSEKKPETKKDAEAMDAAISATVMKSIAQRDALARRLTPHVGAFDHAEMTPGDVVTYGLSKLGIAEKAPKGQEASFLDGYLSAKPAPTARPAFAMDAADTTSTGERPAFISNYAKE